MSEENNFKKQFDIEQNKTQDYVEGGKVIVDKDEMPVFSNEFKNYPPKRKCDYCDKEFYLYELISLGNDKYICMECFSRNKHHSF